MNGDQLLPPEMWGSYITAQKRSSKNELSGFVFDGGVVEGSGKVILGRAWGPYSRVIFQRTKFDVEVTPQGWDNWDKPM